jgi:hypothetical protein
MHTMRREKVASVRFASGLKCHHNKHEAALAYRTASEAVNLDPTEADAWIIMGMNIHAAPGFSEAERFQNLPRIVAALNHLNLTPEQAGDRDALAQQIASMQANASKARAAAEAKSEAATKEAAEVAKKACGWFCNDVDLQYYTFCYRRGAEDRVARSASDQWCSCSLSFLKGKLSAGKLAFLVNRLSGERSGNGSLDQALSDFELMGYMSHAQATCNR